MAQYNSTIVTNAGIELLNKCEAGQAVMEFTSFCVGDGEYTEEEKKKDALKLSVDLKSKKQSFAFASKTVQEASLKLAVILSNNNLNEGYYMREFGVFARDKSSPDSEPILYSITVADNADYMPAKNPEAPTNIAMDYFTVISSDVEVTIVVDSSAYVPAKEFEELAKEVEAQGDRIEELETSGGEALTEHVDKIICSTEFVHGMRYDEETKKLICKNAAGEEIEIETGGGGATTLIVVSTQTDSFVGKKVTATGEYGTYEGVFGEDKKCSIKVQFIGTYTIACEGYETTAEVTQVGTVVEAEINEHYAPVAISTKSDEFKGKSCVIKNAEGGEMQTVTLPSTGSVSVNFFDTGLYTFTVTYEGKEYTSKLNITELDKPYPVSVNFIMVYGFHVSGSLSDPSAMVTYPSDVENAGFTPATMNLSTGVMNYGSWKGVLDEWLMPKPCMLKYDGTVAYYLNPDDYTKKADGTASDVTNTSFGGNAMMEWGQGDKKIWTKIVPDSDGKGGTVYIADGQWDEDFHCYNHIDCDGNIKDHFYTPIYNGSYLSSKIRSLSGQTCGVSQTATTEISYAVANNPDSKRHWYTEVLADWQLVGYLLVLLSKSTDTQTKFGSGRSSSSNSNAIATGTMDKKGLFWGDSGAVNGVKVFGMENPWGNIWRRIAGYINDKGTLKYKLTASTADGSTAAGYNETGSGYLTVPDCTPGGSSGGYISEVKVTDKGIWPKTASGSGSTYYCDGLWFNNSQVNYAIVGGGWDDALPCGAFSVGLNYLASRSNTNIGASLSYK